MDVLRAELLSWRGLVQAMGEPFRPVRRSGPEETVSEFVRRRLGDEVLDAIIAPFCSGVFAGDPDQLSMRAAFPKVAALEDEGGLVRASVARMARRLFGQEARGAPRPRLAAPRGGMGALVAALAREVGPRIQLGCPAVAIEVEAGGRARAVRLADGRREAFDAVVLAVPAPAAARLVSDTSGELAHLLDEIRYAAVAVLHLGFRREDVRAPEKLDGFGFLVARGEELRLLGTVFDSVIWPSRAPDGRVLLRCVLGGARDPGAVQESDGHLVDQARRDLERAIGLDARPVHVHVVRWPRAIAQYTVGHLDRVARAETLAEPLGVVLAGASYHGVAVNSCTADAARVAHQVAARLGLAVAVSLMIGASGCSGGPVSGPPSGAPAPGDGGAAQAAGAARAGADGEERGPAEPPGPPGSVDVSIEWLSPPAELVTAAGRNRCGAPRRPPLSVGSLGGVEGAVVRLEGVALAAAEPGASGKRARKKGREAAELAVRRCGLSPRAVRVAGPGALVALTSFDQERREVSLESVPQGKGEAALLARVPLVLVGQRVEIGLEGAGLVHVTSAADPASDAWVVVPEQEQAYVAVSDARGRVRFEGVPAGKYEVSVWHPPVGDRRPPLTARAPIEVTSGAGASATVSLAPARPAAAR